MWYAVTWLDIDGIPFKREVIDRSNAAKMWAYIHNRVKFRDRIPDGAFGVWFSEALPSETWNDLFDEARTPSMHPEDVPLLDSFRDLQGFER